MGYKSVWQLQEEIIEMLAVAEMLFVCFMQLRRPLAGGFVRRPIDACNYISSFEFFQENNFRIISVVSL